MSQLPTARPVAASVAKARQIQSAEMAGLVGVKAVFVVQGVILLSMVPETSTEALAINAAIQALIANE
jgi:hypothetical protein